MRIEPQCGLRIVLFLPAVIGLQEISRISLHHVIGEFPAQDFQIPKAVPGNALVLGQLECLEFTAHRFEDATEKYVSA